MNVTLRAAARDRTPGVRTFYLSSFTEVRVEYTLKVIRRPGRRTTTCTCPDMVHRRFPRRRHCKHARTLWGVIALAGGVSKIPGGTEVTVPLTKEK